MWPFSSPYPQKSVGNLDVEYDYIVLGGGNAGCVLARRLSEAKHTVLLVEKGDAEDSWLNRTPLTSMHHYSDGKHSTVFDSAPDSRFGRAFSLITGRGLGGTTRVNAGQFTCGVPAEYNAWSEDGRPGWGYHDLKPYFAKSQTWLGPVPEEYHGSCGPLMVRSYDEYDFGSSKEAAKAANDLGFVPIVDMHSPLQPSIGWTKLQYTVAADGTRASAFRAYLPHAVVSSLSNLHICVSAVAGQVHFSRETNGQLRVDSVQVLSVDGGRVQVIKAKREIVLAVRLEFQETYCLIKSGVGPQTHLEDMGIEVVRDTPGVGAHLVRYLPFRRLSKLTRSPQQDHVMVPTVYNCPLSDSLWLLFRRPYMLFYQLFLYLWYGIGWFICNAVELEIFGMTSLILPDGKPAASSAEAKDPFNPKSRPDFAIMGANFADFRGPDADRSKGFFALNCALMKAESRGHLLLRSRDPLQDPICEMNYLSAPEDWAALRAALRVSVQLAHRMRANGYPLDAIRTRVPSAFDDESLDAFIREKVNTIYHYASSCRMAPETDALPGVVDPELRVHGVSNLRVCDSSIFPSAPATHPQALVYAVAEKCADMMLRASDA
ncbi:alcohol oxidase [Mycena rosella]|uniref:Alcohol oxidase n=1 Tax=Mycena rosella TaxID=1033263 RepID=A0AAD7DPX0_MYCRO|nr:alcohol oxidase [Mycena rosella]